MPSQLASVPLKIRLTSRPNGQCSKSNEFPTLGLLEKIEGSDKGECENGEALTSDIFFFPVFTA